MFRAAILALGVRMSIQPLAGEQIRPEVFPGFGACYHFRTPRDDRETIEPVGFLELRTFYPLSECRVVRRSG